MHSHSVAISEVVKGCSFLLTIFYQSWLIVAYHPKTTLREIKFRPVNFIFEVESSVYVSECEHREVSCLQATVLSERDLFLCGWPDRYRMALASGVSGMEVAEHTLCLHFVGYSPCSCCFILLLCLEAGVVLGFCQPVSQIQWLNRGNKVSANADFPLYKGNRRKTSPFLPFSGHLVVDPEMLHAIWKWELLWLLISDRMVLLPAYVLFWWKDRNGAKISLFTLTRWVCVLWGQLGVILSQAQGERRGRKGLSKAWFNGQLCWQSGLEARGCVGLAPSHWQVCQVSGVPGSFYCV